MRYVQTDRPIKITTPLGPDKLLVTSVVGREALCELFRFEVQAVAEHGTHVPFEDLLGRKATLEVVQTNGSRYVNGIVNRVVQEGRDEHFVGYHLTIVPQFWQLTRKMQSRIFQHKSIPDVLKAVLEGMEVSYELQGDWEARDYCVQYRETDFEFASRLMEEEGIYYFFKHSSDGHKLVLANTPQSHPGVPYQATAIYDEIEATAREDDRVCLWHKSQEIRSGKYLTWDECFQMPGKHLDAQKTIQDSVQVGSVNHRLKVGGNDRMELYEFPGGYAGRFDDLDKGGGLQPNELTKIFSDGPRTVDIRMQQEAVGSLLIHGRGAIASFTAGHAFDLTDHFSDNGKFILTSVEHRAKQPVIAQAQYGAYEYSNEFTCIPVALPYRPQRKMPKPSIRGVQSATVVGPSGEEIYTDKYGRVKVQFHWDRDGTNDVNSSCWARVATYWAGKQWGAIHIPRIGQEVIVDFMEGDVDQPIIVGSVYNADMMPPYTLPDDKTQSGIKSRSSKGGGSANYNEIRFEDKMGSEQILVHAEKDLCTEVENDESRTVGRDRTTSIGRDETISIGRDRSETVGRNETIKIGKDRTESVAQNETITIGKDRTESVAQNESLSIGRNRDITIGQDESREAGMSIELKVGQSSIRLDQTGVTIKGMMITIEGQVQVQVKGLMTQVNGTAMLKAQGGLVMIN
jgi:type VI secretion system secreted protein VgrG